MFFVFIGDVKALKMFNSFKEGDKINVYLNESDVGEFTVIEDTDPDDIYALAIYNTHYGNEEYEYNDAKELINEIKNDWVYVFSNVSFVEAEQIVDNFNDHDVDFTTPSWAITNFNYWTANASYYVENQVEHSSIKKDVSNSKKAYIRPVVNVPLIFVKEGVNKPISWNQFIEYFLEILDYSDVLESDNCTYGNDFINIKIDENNYANFSFDGSVLKLAENKSTEAIDYMISYLYMLLPRDEKIKLDKLSSNKIIKTDNFTLVYDKENNKVTEFAINLDYYFGFAKNNASNIDNEVINDVQNPKTSDINIVIIGMITLIVLSGVIVGIRRLKKLSK